MAVLLIGAYLLWITPLRAGAWVRFGGGRPRGELGVMVWGAALRAGVEWKRDQDGRLGLQIAFRGRWFFLTPGKKRKQADPGRVIRAFKGAAAARTLLRRTVILQRADITAAVGGESAARTARITGALRALGAAAPMVRVRCRPVFGGHSAAEARCIVETRLGTLITACLLGAISYRRAGRKEANTWNIPSET